MALSTRNKKSVLVVSYSNIVSDPRVRRQVEWLTDAGWEVTTLGLGSQEVPGTSHYQLKPREMHRFVRGIALLLTPKTWRFKFFVSSQIPVSLTNKISQFQAVVVNEIDLLPWVDQIIKMHDKSILTRHLDLHEYHEFETPAGLPRFLSARLRKNHDWMLAFVGKIEFTSFSSVAPGIAKLYEERFGLSKVQLVYNSRPHYELQPSKVQDENIELIYHGNAQADRGLELLLRAAADFESRFTLNLMLTGDPVEIERLKLVADGLGITPNWLRPVSMSEVPQRINEFDLEIIFYPPHSPNLLFSFPNKFFEAIQARIGLIIGESPSMLEEVERYDIGFVVHGWSKQNLVDTVNSITTEEVHRVKQNTMKAARQLITSNDQKAFLSNF